MAEVMIKIFILMVGFFFGFGVAGAYSIRTVAEKAQIREELEKTKKELEKAQKSQTISPRRGCTKRAIIWLPSS